MVDWSLARQVARLSAGADEAPEAGLDLAGVCAELEGHVAEYTGLEPSTPVPPPELVSRAEWASANLGSLSDLLDPVAERLDRRLSFAGPLAGALRVGAAATVAAEAGLVMGYVSQRVLGQYDVSLLGGDRPPRLLFVAPNLRKAVAELDVERAAFERWICAHELTHVFQFQGVPWLREHLASLIRRYLESVEVRIDRGAAGGLPSLPSPARLVETFREGGLAALIQTREQRAVMARLQSAMAVIEGYSEHVMDALGERLIPELPALRDAMDRRRHGRSAPERVVERLLGLDLKLQQYERGKAFSDAVVAQGGIEALNLVWSAPAALPDERELRRPELWLRRVAPARLPRAASHRCVAARPNSAPPRNPRTREGVQTCVRWYSSTELRVNKTFEPRETGSIRAPGVPGKESQKWQPRPSSSARPPPRRPRPPVVATPPSGASRHASPPRRAPRPSFRPSPPCRPRPSARC